MCDSEKGFDNIGFPFPVHVLHQIRQRLNCLLWEEAEDDAW